MITGKNTYREGSLTAMPVTRVLPADFKTGIQTLHMDGSRDSLIYIPGGYSNDKPAALAVMLHGAGGVAEHGLHLVRSYADEHNIILLAPASRHQTWDIIARNSFGNDVLCIDQLLSNVFDSYALDKSHIAIGGFSDGASYALCLGLINGQLFTHVIAFSPGFYFTTKKSGKPSVFISHGEHDHILPINPCSRKIVPDLKRQGYDVLYHEFDGEHEIPTPVSTNAINWFRS